MARGKRASTRAGRRTQPCRWGRLRPRARRAFAHRARRRSRRPPAEVLQDQRPPNAPPRREFTASQAEYCLTLQRRKYSILGHRGLTVKSATVERRGIDVDAAWIPPNNRHGGTCRDRGFYRFGPCAHAGSGAPRRRAEQRKRRADENYWREIQQAFTLDRTIVNLNNGGCCPSPRVVHEAFKRYLDLSNQAPVYHMWQMLEPNIESVRRQLAAEFGCDAEELAITRNASEALQIAQLGIELQRRRRGGHDQPGLRPHARHLGAARPPRRHQAHEDLVSGAAEVTGRARRPAARRDHAGDKVLHFCHITNLTGQIFPVKRICDEARRRGVKTIVDGAHAFAHFPYKASDLGCDYLRHEPAQVAAGANRHGFPLRAAREHRGAVAADAGRRREEERHPEVRGDRHASRRESQRDRRSAGVPSRASASSGRRRACATCATGGRRGSQRTRR